jgi:tripartite-type tricarboxylate transporter receptor subunit TctC
MNARPTRRQLLAGGAAAVAGLALAPRASAQDKFPTKPIRIVVGLPPGGAADASMRVLGTTMQPLLGQPLVVDNKPGAGFALALSAVAQAPADGYTLLHVVSPMLSNQAVQKRYDMFKQLQPIARVGSSDIAFVVSGKSPHHSMQELIAWGKANPGKLTYASPGVGSLEHLALDALCQRNGISATHVPFKGGPEMVQAVASGEADLSTLAVPLVLQFAPKGMVRPLVVLSDKRNAALPDVPSLKDIRLDVPRVVIWGGLAAPAGTPAAVMAELEKAALAAMENPELRKQYTAMGLDPDAANSATFAKIWSDDWAWISKAATEAKLGEK